MTILYSTHVLTPTGDESPGWVEVRGDTIVAVGTARPPALAVDLGEHYLVPGFVDMHVHGGGGHDITTGDPAAAAAAVAFHQRHGTTSTVLSLVTGPADHLVAASRALAALVESARRPSGRAGQVVGLHLEGPFLAACRCGAQDPAYLREPDPDLLARLLDAARDTVRMVTVAPERPGGVELVGQIAAAGVVAAMGHSDATFAEARRAVEAGARVATHLFNGMRPLHHREPGIAGAALVEPSVTAELIVDGHHVHPGAVRLAAVAKGDGGVALVTDAIAAAGAPDGGYRLGRLDVEVAGGVARLAGPAPAAERALAGSTLTMDAAVRNAVAAGMTLGAASRAASIVPARVLGIAVHTGSIAPGKDADIVVLDRELAVAAVVARGEVVRAGAGLALGPLAP